MNPEERIRQGVETMRRNGAPEAVIRAYIERETAKLQAGAPVAGGGGRGGGPGAGGPASTGAPTKPPGLTAGETLRGAGRAFAGGLTAQWADELEAGARTGSFSGPRYEAVRDSLRGEQAKFAQQYPKANFAAEMAGGIAPVVGATLLSGGAAAPAAATTKLLPALARGAGVGAAYGGATGAGMARTKEEIPGATATGVIAGGMVGGALPAGAALAKGAGRAGFNLFDRGIRELAESGGLTGRAAQKVVPKLDDRAAKIAEQRIYKSLIDDGLTPEQAARRLGEMQARGVPAAVVDAGEENTLEVLNTAFLTPGPGRRTASQYARERVAGMSGRLAEQLEEASGAKLENLNAVVKRIAEERREPARQLYKAAFESGPLQLDERAVQLLTSKATGDLRGAWFEGLRRSTLDETLGGPMPALQPLFRRVQNEAGEDVIELVRPPSARDIDFIKRGLDVKIEKAVRDRDGYLAKLLTQTKNTLLEQTDAQVPAYREAREFWAGQESLIRAMDLGKKFLRGSEDDFGDLVAGMTQDELLMYRRGAANALAESLRKRDGRMSALNVLTDPTAQARLKAVFPDAESFNLLKQVVDDELKGAAPFARMTRQSQTAQNLAGLAELVDNAGAMALDPKSAALMQLLRATRGNTEAVSAQTARLLTQQGPAAGDFLTRLGVPATTLQQTRRAATGASAQGILGGRFGGSMGAGR